ncbi:MAG: DUF3416 domain-containing protein, partial [Chloroflexi bacterium]
MDAGRFPVKRAVGEGVIVEADIFADGHDTLAAVLKHRHESTPDWTEVPMTPLVNDRWRGRFNVTKLGRYAYTIEGWVDHYRTWSARLAKRIAAGQDIKIEIEIGARLIDEAAARASGQDAAKLTALATAIRKQAKAPDAKQKEDLDALMDRHADRSLGTRYQRELEVVVEPERARFGAWYETFPRSAGKAGVHGTFRDLENRLPYISDMGFDILYLPPIHPVGKTHRKGRNNSTRAEPGEPGSPWAIGSEEGGHKAINPQLGTLDDFKRLVSVAGEHGLSIALDIAFQCSP